MSSNGRPTSDSPASAVLHWAGRVLAGLGLPLTVLRKVLLWFGTSDPAALRRDVFPIYMAETPEGFYYGFPVIDGLGHKVARHDGGPDADPAEQQDA